MLLDENDKLIARMQGQVASLKAVTIEIGNEAREQNLLLNSMVVSTTYHTASLAEIIEQSMS